MVKLAAFLRAVNVGGKNQLNMGELKTALVDAGFEDVASYINSGNLALLSRWKHAEARERIGTAISERFGLDVEVIVKDERDLDALLSADPYSPVEKDPAKRLVALLSKPAGPGAAELLAAEPSIAEPHYLDDDLIYIYYREGVGRSKFSNSYIEKKLGISATSRNWNTLRKMREMLHDGSP